MSEKEFDDYVEKLTMKMFDDKKPVSIKQAGLELAQRFTIPQKDAENIMKRNAVSAAMILSLK